MKTPAAIVALVCLAFLTRTLASVQDTHPIHNDEQLMMDQPMLDDEPGAMRRLQAVLMDGHDADAIKKTAKAADAVKGVVVTKVEGVQNVIARVGEKASQEIKQAVKADGKMLNSVAAAAHKSFKSSGEAIAATSKAIGVGAANIVTLGHFSHAAQQTSKDAHKQVKQAVKKAARGVQKVKGAVAKAADRKADALGDTADAAAHAVKRATIKDAIANRLAAMKVKKAVGAGVKAVTKP